MSQKKKNGFRVIDVNYHRNGVGGEGFMTGIFEDISSENPGDIFTFVLFASFSGWEDEKRSIPKEKTFDEIKGDYRCAILSKSQIQDNSVKEAWRGDFFYNTIVKYAVKEYQRQMDAYYKRP